MTLLCQSPEFPYIIQHPSFPNAIESSYKIPRSWLNIELTFTSWISPLTHKSLGIDTTSPCYYTSKFYTMTAMVHKAPQKPLQIKQWDKFNTRQKSSLLTITLVLSITMATLSEKTRGTKALKFFLFWSVILPLYTMSSWICELRQDYVYSLTDTNRRQTNSILSIIFFDIWLGHNEHRWVVSSKSSN